MTPMAHWHIEAENGPLSTECVDRGIISFQSLIEWVEQLPYKRNTVRGDYAAVLTEECGTCSTKNALAKAVALENGWHQVKLFVGIYQLSCDTNPPIAQILKSNKLDALPEAHTFLRINDEVKDLTGIISGNESWQKSIGETVEIEPAQIGDFKQNWYQKVLVQFAHSNNRSIAEINEIREACVHALSN